MPPGAVLLDPAEAADMVRALDLLADVLAKLRDERGNPTPSTPSPRLAAITDKLRKASRIADDPRATDSGIVRKVAPQHIPVDARGHAAVMGTGAAARTLGLTPGAVRDLGVAASPRPTPAPGGSSTRPPSSSSPNIVHGSAPNAVGDR